MTEGRLKLLAKGAFVFILVLAAVLAPPPLPAPGETPPQAASAEAPAGGGKEERIYPLGKDEIKDRIEEIQKEMDLYIKQRESIQSDDGLESEMLRKVTVALGSAQNVYSRYRAAIETLNRQKKRPPKLPNTTENPWLRRARPTISPFTRR